ncbi:MAG: hypothetical protein ACE15C_05195 [Phycisphaerae bacterium]
MKAGELARFAADKSHFASLADYIEFCRRFMGFVAGGGMQGTIVSLNENHYQFYQYRKDGGFKVSRPFNTNLMYAPGDEKTVSDEFPKLLANAHEIKADDRKSRGIIGKSIYTIQQSIGIALDAHVQSNTARKIAGDLFERFIRLLVAKMGVDCRSGTVNIPVVVQGIEEFKMSYQHDLVIRQNGQLKVLGSVKTSSKDRLDKIFIDKFLYSKLTDTQLPHVAIFLNDVQRKGKHPRYGINATFLPGHFKGYSIKLNPLDGVYYCDLRPNMTSDAYLATQIHSIDRFLCDDLWEFLAAKK